MKSAGVAAVMALLVAGCGATARSAEVAGPAQESGMRVNPTAERSGPLSDGALVDCVEQYSPAAVSRRAFAFDGVVVDIGSTVVVDLQAPARSYGLGSRLLVSGEPRWGGTALEDAIAWGCAFTRYYDPATANSWRRALDEPRVVDESDERGGWKTINYQGVGVDIPAEWQRLDVGDCEFRFQRWAPSGTPACEPDAAGVGFYGSNTALMARGPGVWRADTDGGKAPTWVGYVYAGDYVVHASNDDRDLVEQVLDSARPTRK